MRDIRSEAPAAVPQALSDQQSAPQKLAYSVREAAALTGLGRSTVYVLLGQKKLASLRVGGRRLIPHAALVALLGGN